MAKLPDSLIQYLRERREQEAALGYRGYGKKQVADALAKIAGALKGVDDPAVHSFDEESPGLLRLLDQVADPDQYDSRIPYDGAAMDALENLAQTIDVAFELGKAAGSGKVDSQAAWRLRHAQDNADKSAKKRREDAEKWFAMVERIVAEERAQSPDLDQIALGRLTWERMKKELGDDNWCPAESTIYDAIRKKIDGKLASGRKATRRGTDTRRI